MFYAYFIPVTPVAFTVCVQRWRAERTSNGRSPSLRVCCLQRIATFGTLMNPVVWLAVHVVVRVDVPVDVVVWVDVIVRVGVFPTPLVPAVPILRV